MGQYYNLFKAMQQMQTNPVADMNQMFNMFAATTPIMTNGMGTQYIKKNKWRIYNLIY